MGISPLTIALESCSNPQKIQQVFGSAMKKKLCFGFFCEWHRKWSCFRPTSSAPRPKL